MCTRESIRQEAVLGPTSVDLFTLSATARSNRYALPSQFTLEIGRILCFSAVVLTVYFRCIVFFDKRCLDTFRFRYDSANSVSRFGQVGITCFPLLLAISDTSNCNSLAAVLIQDRDQTEHTTRGWRPRRAHTKPWRTSWRRIKRPNNHHCRSCLCNRPVAEYPINDPGLSLQPSTPGARSSYQHHPTAY